MWNIEIYLVFDLLTLVHWTKRTFAHLIETNCIRPHRVHWLTMRVFDVHKVKIDSYDPHMGYAVLCLGAWSRIPKATVMA